MAGGNARKGWDNLSSSQRGRYLSAGRSGRLTGEPFISDAEVRRYYEAGGNLGGGRGHAVYDKVGHKLLRPDWAAPKDATDRAKVSLLTDADRTALRKWRRSRRAPKWIPSSSEKLRDDVAGILSEIDVGPREWTFVGVEPTPTGRYQLYIKIRRRDTAFVTTLPDWDAVSDLGRLLNDFSRLTLASSKAERTRLEREWRSKAGRELHIRVDIADTDAKARRTPKPGKLTPPKAGTGPALAPKKAVKKVNQRVGATTPTKKSGPVKKVIKKKPPVKKTAQRKKT